MPETTPIERPHVAVSTPVHDSQGFHYADDEVTAVFYAQTPRGPMLSLQAIGSFPVDPKDPDNPLEEAEGYADVLLDVEAAAALARGILRMLAEAGVA